MAARYLISLLMLTTSLEATLMTIEAETSRGQNIERSRTSASGGKTIYLTAGDVVSYTFCLMGSTKMNVDSIGYTNDGGTDEVQVSVGKVIVGSFNTKSHSNGGILWNKLDSSGPVGKEMILEGGLHRIKLKVMSADSYGLEIDSITLDVDDVFLGKDSKTFTCELPCLQEIPTLSPQAAGTVSDGYIKQYSYPTRCAEEDNIDIPVFHPSVSEYQISATPPLYHSFENYRSPDTANCPFLPPEYWQFANVSMDRLIHSQALSSNGATLGLSDSVVNGLSTPSQFSVVFRLNGRSNGFIDSEIGSRLDLALAKLNSASTVVLFFKGRTNSFLKQPPVMFTPNNPSHTWDIPDYTWKENYENEIVFQITSQQAADIVIKNLQMKRRNVAPDRAFRILANSEVVIEGVDIDFWWRAPETMRVTLTTTGETWNKTDYIRISVPVPWNNTWCQVFVMYQDGNVRLLPTDFTGVDWIPFGSSVVVGQSNSDDHRPVAPISTVHINPDDLTMDVDYIDGGHARLELFPLVEKTKLVIKNLNFAKDTKTHPFATFRSMFVDAGNDDSDSVMTDKSGPDHILGNWGTLHGTSFLFFRRCQSNHLTQSPNLRLDIISN